MVDYSKWNNIDLSDDDSDCHPNIEKNTWLRMKKDTKLRKAEEAAALAMREDAEHEADRKRAAEIEEKLRAEDSESLRQEHAKLVSKMNAHIAKRAKQAEMEKKYPKWDEASICRDGFSKTIVNKPASQTTTTTTASSSSSSATTTTTATPSPAPFVPSKKVVAPVVTEPSRIGKAALTGRSQEQIVALENKAHYFAKLHSFEDMYQYIGLNRDIINPDVQTYLLLYCSDNLKRGQDTASKRYLRASCVVQYCKDLGPDGIALFFARMRDPNPRFRTEFDRETTAYWGRIKEKLPELRAAGQPLPEDEEAEDEQYEVLGEIKSDAPENVPIADLD